MRRTIRTVLFGLIVAGLCAGCGNDVTPGVNKGKDKPVPAEQPAEKKG